MAIGCNQNKQYCSEKAQIALNTHASPYIQKDNCDSAYLDLNVEFSPIIKGCSIFPVKISKCDQKKNSCNFRLKVDLDVNPSIPTCTQSQTLSSFTIYSGDITTDIVCVKNGADCDPADPCDPCDKVIQKKSKAKQGKKVNQDDAEEYWGWNGF